MIRRYLHHVKVERPPVSETATEARTRLADKFPRQALRRMTHLGMLVGASLEGVAFSPEDALVYATTFAETRALEDFLTSFPAASPLLFQTSIHPGAVQQVLIGRQQPVARLWPLAGRARLVEQALLTALLEPAPRVVLAGGEERGTWMLAQGMASERSFAFAAVLTPDAAGAVGCVEFIPAAAETVDAAQTTRAVEGAVPDACPSLEEFSTALAERTRWAWQSGGGAWSLTWL